MDIRLVRYILTWLRNLVLDLLAIVGVVVGMALFLRVFYPEVLDLLMATVQVSAFFISALRLWPLVFLALIVHAAPRRKRRR